MIKQSTVGFIPKLGMQSVILNCHMNLIQLSNLINTRRVTNNRGIPPKPTCIYDLPDSACLYSVKGYIYSLGTNCRDQGGKIINPFHLGLPLCSTIKWL